MAPYQKPYLTPAPANRLQHVAHGHSRDVEDPGLTEGTGAAGSIGVASARRLAAEGGRVVLADLATDAAEEAAAAIRADGGEAVAHTVDVTDPGSVERLYAARLETAGEQVTLHAAERARDGDTYTYDLDVRDSKGRLVERWEGIATYDAAVRAWNRSDPRTATALVAGLLRRPVRLNGAVGALIRRERLRRRSAGVDRHGMPSVALLRGVPGPTGDAHDLRDRGTVGALMRLAVRPTEQAVVTVHRLIPALAGNTTGDAFGAPRRPAHPRARGEHRWCQSTPSRVSGSSPRSPGDPARSRA